MNKDAIKEITKLDKKNLIETIARLMAEVGSLAKAISGYVGIAASTHRFVPKEKLAECLADLILVLESLRIKTGVSEEELERQISLKADKWLSILQREAKVTTGILFELHHTVSADSMSWEEFKAACLELKVKPIKTSEQYFITQCPHKGDNNTVQTYSESVVRTLVEKGASVTRTRIETSLANPVVPWREDGREHPMGGCYFEGHINLCMTPHQERLSFLVDEINKEGLVAINQFSLYKCNVDLSDKSANPPQIITVRLYDGTAEDFLGLLRQLENRFVLNQFSVVSKTNPEYVVYDSKKQKNWHFKD